MADAMHMPPEIEGLSDVSARVVYPHVFENADREVGGVLVGRTPADSPLPVVTGAISAIAADEQRATLTFTQDAWEHVHRVLDRDFPDDQIVGWYHSHPGFGIFLSEHDLFIHRNFFSGPSQIAQVVDPIGGTEGVFVWNAGNVEELFTRPTPRMRSAPGPQARRRVDVEPLPPVRRAFPVLPVALAAVLGAALGLLVARAALSGDEPTRDAQPPAATPTATATATATAPAQPPPPPPQPTPPPEESGDGSS